MLSKIISIAKDAGEILMKYHSTELNVETKSNEYDMLTKADLESDDFIRKKLKEEFPEDALLSEENEEVPPDYEGRVWMIDPLDGTKDFVHKGSSFSVIIGLCENGIPVLGVVFAPAKNLLFYAEKGKGAFLEKNGKKSKLHVSDVNSLDRSRFVTRIAHGETRDLDKLISKFKVKEEIQEGSIGIKLGIIANSEAEFHLNANLRLSKWDTCAPQVILEEAGGKVTDFDGKPLDYKQPLLKWKRSLVGSNSVIHSAVINFIKENE